MRRLLLASLFALSVPVPPGSAFAQPPASDVGVLVIAHGAGETWNAPVVSAVERVRRSMPAAVGFLMGKGATPQQAYDALVQQGASRVVVVPLLISSHSAHAEQIRFLAGARADYPHAEHMHLEMVRGPVPIVTVTPAMDDDRIIADILADRARALSGEPQDETFVLVGHGPNEDDEAALWTAAMGRLASYVRASVPFRSVETRLLRDDAPKLVKDRALAELRETVAAHAASGRVVVVPLLLSPGSVAEEIPTTLAGLDFAWNGHTLLPDDRIAEWILSRVHAAQPTPEQAAVPPAHERSAITGSLADSTGLPIPGAAVVLRNRQSGSERLVHADAQGHFMFDDVAPATYDVIGTLAGFAPAIRTINGPAEESVALVLEPSPYQEAVTVVSEARAERLRDTATVPVTTIGGAAMRDAGYASVAEALHEIAGTITRRGSEGTDVSGEQLQGIDSRQVIVLLDGQPIVGARGIKSGAINLDRQSINGLDRVEVVKGAASALYGSDAIGGVINLIPRDPRRPMEAAGQISGGGYGAFDAAANVGGLSRRGTFFLSAGRHQRDAFDLTPSTPDTTGSAVQRDDVNSRVTVAPSTTWLLVGTATSYWNVLTGTSVGELGTEADRTPSNSQTAGFRAEWRPDARTTAEFRAYAGRYAETSTGTLLNVARTPVNPADLHEGLHKLDASVDRRLGEHQQVRAGAEWIHDSYRGTNRIRDADGDAATTGVLWGQYDLTPLTALTLTTGLRVDDHSLFGTAVSPKLGAVWRVTDAVLARGSYGRGFRAPDLGQLFYRFLNPTNLYQVIGDPTLEPERSSSWQVGVETRAGTRAHVGMNVFRNDVSNLIQAVSLGFISSPAQLAAIAATNRIDAAFNVQLNRLLFLYENVAEARTHGVELVGDDRIGTDIRVSGSYAYTDAIDAITGAALANRNRHQATVRLDWTPRRFGLRANVRGSFYSSWIAGTTRSVSGTSDIVAPGFAVWDVTAAKPVWRTVEAFAAIDNLTNSQDPNTGLLSASGSVLPIYRPEIGRTWRTGVRWNWTK